MAIPFTDDDNVGDWPPRNFDKSSGELAPVPYLESPPDITNIDVGRQLFVDDFLIQKTTMRRRYHTPEKATCSPVLQPETLLEMNGGHCPMAVPFNDGVWYDDKDELYKLWYQAGWFDPYYAAFAIFRQSIIC